MDTIVYSKEQYEGRKKLKETKDCTVMAWSNCFDCDYELAHKWLKRFGRKNRRGMLKDDIKGALIACTKARVKFGGYGSTENSITLNQFVKNHAKGRYYVLVRGHALCVKDGTIYDWKEGKRRMVSFAARVYLEGEI